jgi:hypothetical protein
MDGLSVQTPGAIVSVPHQSPTLRFRVVGPFEPWPGLQLVQIVPCDSSGIVAPRTAGAIRTVAAHRLELVEASDD